MKALVLGNGLSGISACDYLLANGIKAIMLGEEYVNKTSFEKDFLDRLFFGLSFIVVSPGISLENEIIYQAKLRNIKIIGELELGTRNLDGTILAVTGTNGKTTTASLVNFLLKNTQKNIFLGGNIGIPVTKFAKNVKKDDIVVLECSSFQLETINKFHAHIAAILNISPDHLTRHHTMNNYIKIKQKISKNQTKNDYLIINADDECLMNNIPKTKANIFYFSTKKKVVGCYIKNGSIYFSDNQKDIKLTSITNIKLIGEHNLSNILCASLIVYLQTGDVSLFRNLKNFMGVSHRIEFVKKINGIEFYDDSKATNIASTQVAIKSFKKPIFLILGGSDKGYDFDDLFKNISSYVKFVAIYGETRHKIAFFAKKYNYNNFKIFESMQSAIKYLYKNANSESVVLLSPACASFDCFSGYEERGNVFKKVVEEIASNEINGSRRQKKE